MNRELPDLDEIDEPHLVWERTDGKTVCYGPLTDLELATVRVWLSTSEENEEVA